MKYKSLEKNFKTYNIVFAYLFGSKTTGKGWRKNGDIDIAVYLHSTENWLRKVSELENEINQTLGTNKVEITPLNYVSPTFWQEVLSTGTLIYESDRNKRIDIELRHLHEYWDFEFYRRMFHEEMLRRIREGRFGKLK